MARSAKRRDFKPKNAKIERPRLVDHFKRAYQIIVGLAITLACTKLFPSGLPTIPPDITFWLFFIFFLTIVPIFHGGDRSLDIKYLHNPPAKNWAYIFDVYALLITAILFVKVAQSIPVPQAAVGGLINVPAPREPSAFYFWMAIMLFFDVAILIADQIKSRVIAKEQEKRLGAYFPWIIMNALFGVICLCAAYSLTLFPNVSTNAVAICVFIAALVRTVLDYHFGRSFMFP